MSFIWILNLEDLARAFTYKENEVEENNQELDYFSSSFHVVLYSCKFVEKNSNKHFNRLI